MEDEYCRGKYVAGRCTFCGLKGDKMLKGFHNWFYCERCRRLSHFEQLLIVSIEELTNALTGTERW